MKHYKILKPCRGPWKNLMRPKGHRCEVGDIILAGEIDGKANVKSEHWIEATKAEITKAKKK
ncbi:MAG: hypothetical protein ACPG5T_00495 [Endozoicomonas sp.]